MAIIKKKLMVFLSLELQNAYYRHLRVLNLFSQVSTMNVLFNEHLEVGESVWDIFVFLLFKNPPLLLL